MKFGTEAFPPTVENNPNPDFDWDKINETIREIFAKDDEEIQLICRILFRLIFRRIQKRRKKMKKSELEALTDLNVIVPSGVDGKSILEAFDGGLPILG